MIIPLLLTLMSDITVNSKEKFLRNLCIVFT